MTLIEKEDTKDMMKSFESLPKESKRFIQGFIAGLEAGQKKDEEHTNDKARQDKTDDR